MIYIIYKVYKININNIKIKFKKIIDQYNNYIIILFFIYKKN